MRNENNFSNKNVAFVAVAVFAVFAGVTSMMFINTEPTDEDRTSKIETIEVVAEPAEEAEPEVVEDVEGQVRRILDFCGLTFEPSCVEFHKTERAVKTASSEQVRQPIYSSSVNLWRRYQSHLKELSEVLEPLL